MSQNEAQTTWYKDSLSKLFAVSTINIAAVDHRLERTLAPLPLHPSAYKHVLKQDIQMVEFQIIP